MMLASLALELTARLDLIAFGAAAAWAKGFPIRFRPAHLAKQIVSSIFAHLKHSLEGQCAGFCRE
jgi:hypothetical protein